MPNISILLVDDEQFAIDVGTKMLEMLGYKVTPVISSIKALEVFQSNGQEFNLVITDLDMPDMRGNELAAKLRHINPKIPIILTTGYIHITEEYIREWGFDEIIKKPYQLKDIDLLVCQVLQRSQSSI